MNKSSKKDLESIKELTEAKPAQYNMSNDERELYTFVMSRFTDMQRARGIVDKDWQTYQLQWESRLKRYPDGRSATNMPIEFATIEAYRSEADKKKPNPVITTRGKVLDVTRKQIAQKAWECDWIDNERQATFVEDDYKCAIFGTSVMYSGVEIIHRSFEDIEMYEWDDDFRRNRIEFDETKIILDSLDIRDFYPDDRVTRWKDAIDCIHIVRMPYEKFVSITSNPFYKNVDSVTASYSSLSRSYVMNTENTSKKIVELICYYNKELDKNIIIANRQVVIRDMPIMHPTKELPFKMRQFFYNPSSLWGWGIPKVLTSIKSDINTLDETLMEAIKRSNNQIFAIGWDLEFDSQEFDLNNTLVRFNGQFRDNFQVVTGNAPNNAIFQYRDQKFKDGAVVTGFDVTSITDAGGNVTAYQTAVKQELSSKRANNILNNRDLFYHGIFNLHWAMLQKYFPREKAEYINGIVEKNYPTFKMKGEIVEDDETGDMTIVESNVENMFEITPDRIRGSYEVQITTKYNQPSLVSEKREALTQGMANLKQIAEITQILPELQAHKTEFINEIMSQYDIPVDINPESENNMIKQQANDILAKADALSQSALGTSLAGFAWMNEQAPQAQAAMGMNQPQATQGQAMWGNIMQ